VTAGFIILSSPLKLGFPPACGAYVIGTLLFRKLLGRIIILTQKYIIEINRQVFIFTGFSVKIRITTNTPFQKRAWEQAHLWLDQGGIRKNSLKAAGLPAKVFAIGCCTNASAAAQRGIPCFIYGPGSLDQAHVIDEWVALDELVQAVQGYHAIGRACLKG
jgi:hypothetical protein